MKGLHILGSSVGIQIYDCHLTFMLGQTELPEQFKFYTCVYIYRWMHVYVKCIYVRVCLCVYVPVIRFA